jgi:hypothetical protein
MHRQPASLVNSLASQVVSQQYSWTLTRFGSMPTGGDGGGKKVPTGPDGQEGTYWTWFTSRQLGAAVFGLGTYNGPQKDECTNRGEWSNTTYVVSLWIHDTKLTVFGDMSRFYDADAKWLQDPTLDPDKDDLLGTITCSKWKDAKCYQRDSLAVSNCFLGVWDFPMAYCNSK